MDRELLISLIQKSENKLDSLKCIQYDELKGSITELESLFKEFKEGGESLLQKGDILQIGIVGQVKAGKSSFLNSLFFNGENVLPKASTPMTAGLTIIEYSEKEVFEVEYFNEKDWEIFENQNSEYKKRVEEVRNQNQGAPEEIIKQEIKARTTDKVKSAHEMVEGCSSKAKQKIGSKNDLQYFSNLAELQNVLEQYVGVKGEFTSVVKSLYIKMKDERLRGLRIVDTPGVNDPVVSRENRTRTFLHSCHGVFLLSASTDFLSSGDISFLNSRIGGSGIGTVVILASKFDSVLQDIGADREMKREKPGDLFDTAEAQKKKFKRRLRELSDSIDEKLRERLKLDTTAGIGFSISHKPSAKWDDVEKQVVQQMKRYYPDYFETDQDIKESFEALANIDDIRNQFLTGVFMDNKETIIAEKMKEFFANNAKEISVTIDQILKGYETRRIQLNETTIAEIQKQKAMQSRLFDNLKLKFTGIFKEFNQNIQGIVTQISNTVFFNEIRTIPVEDTTGPVTCKGKLWGYKTNEMSYRQVKSDELANQIRQSVEAYSKSWNEEWKKLFDNTRIEMADKLNAAISNFEATIISSSFNDIYYRNLVDNALGELRNRKELEIGGLITDYQRVGDDIAQNQFQPSGTNELEEDQVELFLSHQLREHNEQLIKSFRVLADSIKSDVKKRIHEESLKKAIEVIDEMKNSFDNNLKREGEEYLTSLEKDMLTKTKVLEVINSIINVMTELSILYKS